MKKIILLALLIGININLLAQTFNLDTETPNPIPAKKSQVVTLVWTKVPEKIIIKDKTSPELNMTKAELTRLNNKLELKVADGKIILEAGTIIITTDDYEILIKKGTETNPIILPVAIDESIRSTILDALLLAENKDISNEKLKKILTYYGIDYDAIDSTQNPYLKKFKDDRKTSKDTTNNVLDVSNGGIAKKYGTGGIQAGSLPTPTNVADFLGTFIADRFKQEINIAFLDKFRKDIKDHEKLGILMPTTYKVLTENDPYQYTTFFQTLREGMNEDITNLPDNSVAFATDRLKKITNLNDKRNAILGIMAFDITKDLNKGKTLVGILPELKNKDYIKEALKTTDQKLHASLFLTSTLSFHFQTSDRNGWVSKDVIEKLASSNDAQNVFLGLILAKEANEFDKVKFKINADSSEITLKSYFINCSAEILSDLSPISKLAKEIESYNITLNEIKDIKDTETDQVKIKVPFAKYLKLASSSINIIEQTANVIKIDKRVYNFKNYVKIAQSGIGLIQHLDKKEYGLAFSDAVNLVEDIGYLKTKNDTTEVMKSKLITDYITKSKVLNGLDLTTFTSVDSNIEVSKDNEDAVQKEIHKSLKALKSKIETDLNNRINDSTSVKQMLLKYGNFAVSVINAKSTDEAVQALEAAALPVGSYRIKRNNYFNISINAYGGLFAGRENFSYLDKIRENFVWGATAPVGIYFGWGKQQVKVKENDGCGLGFFVSLLDVGSVFAIRVQDNVSPLPELAWRNILAPGIHAVWNIKKLPVSLMFGYQKGPELRNLKEEITNQVTGEKELKAIIDPTAGRFAVSAVIDIPIFNVFTKANKNK